MRSAHYRWGWCLVFAALAAYGWFGARHVSRTAAARPAAVPALDRRPPPREERDELEAVREELSALRAELGTLRTAERMRAPAAPPPESTVLAPSSAEQEQRYLNYMTEFDQRFREEPRDHAWADTAADEIRGALANAADGANLVTDIDCRSRTCKLELADADGTVLAQGIDQLVQELASTLPNARIGHNGDVDQPKPNAVYFTRASPEDSVPAVARK